MLYGVEDQVITLIREMEKSEFNFHLTGSRFFGMAGPDSDWDFFALDTPEIRNWLLGKGFHQEFNNHYVDDPNLASVFRSGNLHVQLVPDTYSKMIVQSALAKTKILQNGNKRLAKEYWKLGYALLESIVENVPKENDS